MWPDYDLDNPSTWVPMESPTVDSSWDESLTRIGGLNPFGKPNLVWRWGATYRDPMAEDNGLKYWLSNRESQLIGFTFTDPVTGMALTVARLEGVPKSVMLAVPQYSGMIELGQRRIIIEQWRSPEFLTHSRRYTESMRREPDDLMQFFQCKACDSLLTVGDDGPSPCPKCGSKRSYLREFREPSETLLRSFPTEGCYDCFLILENAEGGPMEPDANALAWIEKLWHEQKTKTLKEQLRDSEAEMASQHELIRAATNPANPFRPPAVSGW